MNNADMPAMPITLNPGEFAADGMNLDGLTKREYFAALAMQGLIAGKDGDSQLHDSAPEWVADVTEAAVEFADALLAELDKRGEQ